GSMSEDKEKNEIISDDDIIEGEIIESSEDTDNEPVSSISQEEYDQLAQELQQSQTQAKDFFDGWQRERADFANYKRRIQRDQQAMKENLTAEVIKKYLTIVDDLERALKARPDEESLAAWANGIELVLRKLQNILDAEGIKRIPAEKEEFNPSRHEAISYEASPDHEGGQIIEIIQQGYTLGDRVIRPALVRVARG
ncbi:MAG: nucleotide exchange factor GrpE, partial [Anaerolineaceae bacterium]|nr:nucleotide exchange factor GrpE [Anaerolineaceae bacterium]